jgi:hypothetical protein
MVKTPQIEALPGMGISKPKCEVRSLTTLERWEREGYCKTPCGCRVEPDGVCQHGKKSWLLILGLI